MKLIPLARRSRLATLGLAITAFALLGTAVLLGTTEAYRFGLALSLVVVFNLALLHNLRQARTIARHRRRKSP